MSSIDNVMCSNCSGSYLLNNSKQCFEAIENCKIYDLTSTVDNIACESCEDNYTRLNSSNCTATALVVTVVVAALALILGLGGGLGVAASMGAFSSSAQIDGDFETTHIETIVNDVNTIQVQESKLKD